METFNVARNVYVVSSGVAVGLRLRGITIRCNMLPEINVIHLIPRLTLHITLNSIPGRVPGSLEKFRDCTYAEAVIERVK